MIYNVSNLLVHPKVKDFYYVLVTRQEPEINNNKVYTQKVMGSKKDVKWFRKSIIKKIQQQNERGV